MIFGAIVAGGIGSRMKISSIPKQFMMLGSKPVIIHTIEKFMLCTEIDYIYIGVHKDWTCYAEDLLTKYNINKEKIFITEGGADRNLTILNLINAIESKHGESDDHIIITHDAVRPFVTLRIIKENIKAARKYKACDTVVASNDTIISSDNGKVISSIPERKTMFLGQTPQSFNMSLLKRLYMDLSEEEKSMLTDACKICVVRDTPVHLVRGDASNLKITTVSDYKIAQAMVGGRKY